MVHIFLSKISWNLNATPLWVNYSLGTIAKSLHSFIVSCSTCVRSIRILYIQSAQSCLFYLLACVTMRLVVRLTSKLPIHTSSSPTHMHMEMAVLELPPSPVTSNGQPDKMLFWYAGSVLLGWEAIHQLPGSLAWIAAFWHHLHAVATNLSRGSNTCSIVWRFGITDCTCACQISCLYRKTTITISIKIHFLLSISEHYWTFLTPFLSLWSSDPID